MENRLTTISFELPKWAEGKNIYILAGEELIGIMEHKITHVEGEHVGCYDPLLLKTADGRCNGCGSCCESGNFFRNELIVDFLNRLSEYVPGNPCPMLGESGCLFGTSIPFACARSVCTSFANCTERLE